MLKERYLPEEHIAIFDEHISETPDSRLIHGDVTVHVHDESLVEITAKYAQSLLQEKGKLLVVYDNLIQMLRDTSALRQTFCRDCRIDPSHIIMINGQDRQADQMWENQGDFDTGTQPQPHHQAIIGTSSVEMGVNFHGVDAAIIELGPDAAALLQRIGRVARGSQSGIVYVSKPQRDVPSHFVKLQQAQNIVTVDHLREMFGELRCVNTRMVKELGRAYWSMMRRQDRHLMSGMEEAFIELMGEDVSLPGRLLDSLWIAEKLRFPKKREFINWLKAIDATLVEVRGFAPTVKLRFPERSFTYSRDWVTKYLRPPDDYDSRENTKTLSYAKN